MDFSEKVNQLYSQQLSDWELAGNNYGLLSKVKTRKLEMGGHEMILQFNPGRIKSSNAKVDSRSIEERPCFLCHQNRPPEQKSVSFPGKLEILINPYPIFTRHLTIASDEHTDQRIAGNFEKMLDLAKELPDYLVFYNGPQCGASAPDHLHFQAGSRNFLPVEHDYIMRRFTTSMCGQKGIEIWHWSGYMRGMITIEGDNRFKINQFFNTFYDKFLSIQPDKPEPMMNILAYFQTGKWIIHLIPRKLHRPSQFYANGNDQILLSPASVDLGGVLITPREEDFIKMTVNDLKDILRQVCMSDTQVLDLF
jgi:hypothetical protein